MKKSIIALCLLFTMSSCQELLDVLESSGGVAGITQSEAASGLKQALERGVISGTSQLGQNGGFLKNAAYKILMPEEVQKAVSQIRGNPLTNALAGHYIDRVVTSMNTGAENAMAEAKPIFVNAIKSMTITDAINVATGGEGAATSYLKKTTTPQLKTKFQPVIKKSLDKININEPWSKVSTAYNTVTGKKVQTDLNEYVTDRAVVALFSQIKQEEDKIRKDPLARVTPLLKKVFGYADTQK